MSTEQQAEENEIFSDFYPRIIKKNSKFKTEIQNCVTKRQVTSIV